MCYNPYSLANKTILVTGASSGIGRSVAIECSKLGATVVITGRNSERLSETYNQLSGEGHLQIVADLSDYSDIEKLVSQCPQLDGVSNNAGVHKILLLKFVQKQALEDTIAINTVAPILLLQLLVKKKKLAKQSSVVYTAAVAGNYTVHYGDTLFASSKSAVAGFVKSAALDLSAQLIRVNSVSPSVIMTERLQSESFLTPEELKEKESYFPLKRFGNPLDVANAIIFLLSDASSWITGTDMPIDGGYTLL